MTSASAPLTTHAVPAGTFARTQSASAVLPALLCGAAVSGCLTLQWPGLGTWLAALCAVAGWLWVARARHRPVAWPEGLGLALVATFALTPLFRASGWLWAYDVVGVAVVVVLLPALARRSRAELSFSDGAALLGSGLWRGMGGAHAVLKEEMGLRVWSGAARAPLVGLLLAVPVFAVFLALFASADALFAELLGRLVSVGSGSGLGLRACLGVAVAWVMLGLSSRMAPEDAAKPSAAATTVTLPFAPREMAWALFSLVAVFAAFLGVQALQLFGWTDALWLATNASAAAREGFFQLLAVVVLALAVVLVSTLPGQAPSAMVRLALRALLVLTVLVGISAMVRMARYTSLYGLTELRFHASVAMVLLMATLVWAERTAVSGVRSRFLPGAVCGVLATMLAVQLVNPDALIARVNLTRGAQVDVDHLLGLSDDALPTLAEGAARLPEPMRGALCAGLGARSDAAAGQLRAGSVLSWAVPVARAAQQRCR